MSGALQAGTRFEQQRLIDEFGLSRHHAREVIQALAYERLLVTRRNASAEVAPLGLLEYEELHEIRVALEPMLARQALPHLTGSHLTRLHDIHEVMAKTDEVGTWLEAHEAFHSIIYRQAPRPWAVEIVDQSRQLARRYLSVLHAEFRWKGPDDQHARILQAIEARDSLGLERVLKDHMRRAHSPVFEILARIAVDVGSEESQALTEALAERASARLGRGATSEEDVVPPEVGESGA